MFALIASSFVHGNILFAQDIKYVLDDDAKLVRFVGDKGCLSGDATITGWKLPGSFILTMTQRIGSAGGPIHDIDFTTDSDPPVKITGWGYIVQSLATSAVELHINYEGRERGLTDEFGGNFDWFPIIYGRLREVAINDCLSMEFKARPTQETLFQFFTRGDVNGSGRVDLSDPISLLTFLFVAGPLPSCMKAADSDDNAIVDLSDAVYLLTYMFLGGPPPPIPSSVCGLDPTEDTLACNGQWGCSRIE